MSRKLFSLIAGLVLVLGLGVVPSLAQAEEGGTILGTVYEENGEDPPATPIAGVHVVACSDGDNEICYGADSDDSGNYTIAGLTLDLTEYRVFVWGQPGWSNEFWQETIWWHEATLVPVGATGIDFTLLPGGTISGTVTDADGNPLVNMGVDIADGGYGVCTDDDGRYTIVGLPYGTYDIVAGRNFCESNPEAVWKWANEYYKNTPFLEEAKPVKIEHDKNKKNIDFSLELGGSISGTVTDEDKNPMASEEAIDVSACLFDNDSVCWWADVINGEYLITGLPTGEYRVHAYQYRENEPAEWVDEYFDDVKDWNWADPVSVTVGDKTQGINFILSTEYFNPTFLVNLTPNEVLSWGWHDDAEVTLNIYGPGADETPFYTDTAWPESDGEEPWDTFTWFSFPADLGVGTGYRVTLSDGTTTKEHVVYTLSVFPADPKKDVVSGMADPNAEVIVDAWLGAMRRTTADKQGYWSVDFSVPGAEDWEQDIIDIGPGDGGGVNIYDKDGDSTNINWWAPDVYVPQPNFLVNLTPNEVLSWGWLAGEKVTLDIYAPDGDDPIFTQKATAEATGDELWDTFVMFGFPAELGVGPGYRVTLSGGNIVKELIVANLSVSAVDANLETVSGTADPEAEVIVDAWQGAMRRAIADGDGNWSVNFSVPGDEDWEQDTIDIGPGDGGGINIYDEDGDSTNINWWAAPEE